MKVILLHNPPVLALSRGHNGPRPAGVEQPGPWTVVGSRGQDVVGEASKQGMGGTLNQGFGEMGPCPRGSVEEETLETYCGRWDPKAERDIVIFSHRRIPETRG